ncbi:MAG: hypothetical protein Tsb0014_04950 [Pleurocapsa sp.]
MIATKPTNKISDTIEKLQNFINIIDDKNNFDKITSELENIKSSLTEDKLRLQIIGVDNNSNKGCYKLIQEHRNIPKYYDLQTIIFPNQPTITYRDILCLVIDSEERLTRDAKHMIKYLAQSQVIKLIIVIDQLKDDEETIQDIKAYIAETRPIIAQYNPNLDVAFFTVSLKTHYPNPDKKRDIKAKAQLDKLCQEIENIAKYKIKEILLDSPTKQVREQIEKIEDILNGQEQIVETKRQQEENKIKNSKFSHNEIKKEIDITYKKIDRERDKLFKFCRDRLSVWSDTLLDDYDIRGIKYKINKEIENITLVRHNAWGWYIICGGEATIKPEKKNTDLIHKDVIYLYQDLLCKNYNLEWDKICNKYYDNGLEGLKKRIYQTLNYSFSGLLNVPQQLNQDIEIQEISKFFDATKKSNFEWKTNYSRPGLLIFMAKDIKSQLMSFTSLILLFGTAIGSDIEKESFLGILVVVFFIASIVGYFGKTKEIEKTEIEKMKKDGYNFYQSLGKYYVNRVQNFIINQLNIEEQNLKELLDEYKENLSDYINNIETEIKEYERQLNMLQKQKNELNSLVRELK